MRILIAPAAFKGTLSPREAAVAIAGGVRDRLPDADLTILPIADGGDGTLEALTEPLHLSMRTARVTGPLGDPVDAAWGVSADGAVAVVESAAACGFVAASGARRDPLNASTRGAGELLRAAFDAGVREIVVGLGGSLSTDGGAGAAAALGIRFLDARGRDLPPGGGALTGLARIVATTRDGRLAGTRIVALADVDHPLLGSGGSARIFGPQKGASDDQVRVLEAGLARLSDVARRDLGIPLDDGPGAGAAGGLGAGLTAFLGARREPGAGWIAARIGLEPAAVRADAVVTGEGRVDATTFRGKAPGSLWILARARGKRCRFACGTVSGDIPEDVPPEDLFPCARAPRDRADATALLREAASRAAATLGV